MEGKGREGKGVKRLARDDKATAHVDLSTALCVWGGGFINCAVCGGGGVGAY